MFEDRIFANAALLSPLLKVVAAKAVSVMLGLRSAGLFQSRRQPPPAGCGHPEPTAKVRHVPEPDQPGAMFGWNCCRRVIHGCIADRKKRGKLLAGESFRFLGHHPSMTASATGSLVSFAQIEVGPLTWRSKAVAPSGTRVPGRSGHRLQ
jgi:hypothetical protein